MDIIQCPENMGAKLLPSVNSGRHIVNSGRHIGRGLNENCLVRLIPGFNNILKRIFFWRSLVLLDATYAVV